MEDDLQTEYDLKSLQDRKLDLSRKGFGGTTVQLEPDVAEVFPYADAVNEALRFLIRMMRDNQAFAGGINAERVGFEEVQPETSKQEGAESGEKSSEQALPQKAYSIQEIRKTYPRAYEPWTKAEDERLRQCYQQDAVINDIAKEFQRKPGAIRSRLKKLGLLQ